MRRLAPLFLLVLAGCGGHKELLPYFGKWNGAFEVETAPGASPKDLSRETLRGYLMLYGSNRRFLLHLEGEQQTVDLDGAWTLTGKQVEARAKKIEIDDEGGEAHRDPNKKWIPSDDLQTAMGRPIILNLSADAKRLTGPATTIGALQGAYRFHRGD
ncbi:hypothetical protein BH11ARM2_BH11ARM2_00910 [soil metagenome]